MPEGKLSPVSRPKVVKMRGETQEEKKKLAMRTKLQVLLFRHKEMLKKDILKKRALLEKELQIEIQVSYLSRVIFYTWTTYILICITERSIYRTSHINQSRTNETR